jgi:hypothetical protein
MDGQLKVTLDAPAWGNYAPQEQIIIDLAHSLTNKIYFGVLLLFIHFGVDYFLDPERHFITMLARKFGPKIKKWSDKLEDDEKDGKAN